MKKYEILPHPAELRLRIYGKTIEELFQNAALALAEILKSNIKDFASPEDLRSQKIKLKIKSIDINALLVDFLSEILAKSQIHKCIYIVMDIKIDASSFMLHASCVRYPVDHFDEDIKAVTYQDVDIRQLRNHATKQLIWRTDLVLDI